MIKSILICDSQGYPFFSKKLDADLIEIEPAIFSGLISAIGVIGKQLFKEDLATINYGDNYEILIITKDLFSDQKSIYFVFIVEGGVDLKLIKRISTHIFIETKQVLKNPHSKELNINDKSDQILFRLLE